MEGDRRSGPPKTQNPPAAFGPSCQPALRHAPLACQRENLIKASETYFKPWETIFEGNPQRILERGEPVTLPPMFILQGELDDNVLPAVQEKFVAAYRKAGGRIDYELFLGCVHRWLINPGPQTDRAIEMIKAFIARQLQARQPPG